MTTNTTTWIISQPFSRNNYASVTNGLVDYSGYLYNNKGENLTVEEYLAINGHKYPNAKEVSNEEFMKLYQESEDAMKTNFVEITEGQYWDLLECLPPMNWHNINSSVKVFFISEATTGSLHTCVLEDKETGKYYSALRCRFESDEQLLSIYNQSINQ